ncbi:MAG TPA: azurin [Gammaproteobacteria bacterium]|jgi:azurin|nr:azurin [Gammaproteobacteria bacterium]
MNKVKLGLFSVLLLLGAAKTAMADDCQLTIDANDAMAFSANQMSAPASCKEVTVTLNHTGRLPANTMGHNWVLTTAGDFKDVATAGMSAGLDNHYVPQGDARVLAATKIIGGGETDSITFSTEALTAGEEYTFFCSFPGHWAIMKGSFKLM